MNAAEAAALRQACEHVEDHRLAAMADVVVAGGTLAAATDAVRTSTSFGALTESGEIHATSAGLRVRLGDRAQRELSVTMIEPDRRRRLGRLERSTARDDWHGPSRVALAS